MTIKTDGLPATIRVGPYDFKLMREAQIDGGDSYGSFSLNDQELKILKEYNCPELAVDTLIHELLHASWRICGIQKCGEEEAAVSGLAASLTQVFKDNRKVLTWIQRALAK